MDESIVVCILRTAVPQHGESFRDFSNQLALELSALGFTILSASRSMGDPKSSYSSRRAELSYADYFTLETIANPRAMIYVAPPADMSLLNALSAILVKIDEENGDNRLVVLLQRAYWEGFLIWLRGTALQHGEVEEATLDRIVVADTVAEHATSFFITEMFSRAVEHSTNDLNRKENGSEALSKMSWGPPETRRCVSVSKTAVRCLMRAIRTHRRLRFFRGAAHRH